MPHAKESRVPKLDMVIRGTTVGCKLLSVLQQNRSYLPLEENRQEASHIIFSHKDEFMPGAQGEILLHQLQ